MANQKLENLLNLALEVEEAIREKSGQLGVGFSGKTRNWELIVKYNGNIGRLQSGVVKVEELIAGYAVLTVPEHLVDRVAELEEIEYVEKPKRYFYGAEMPSNVSCIAQVTLRDPGLSGEGVLIAVLDSGDGVAPLSGTPHRTKEFPHMHVAGGFVVGKRQL